VDLEDDAQIDEEDRPNALQHGLVGMSLVTHENDSNLDSDTPMMVSRCLCTKNDVENQ
jgi:hypothetical protein